MRAAFYQHAGSATFASLLASLSSEYERLADQNADLVAEVAVLRSQVHRNAPASQSLPGSEAPWIEADLSRQNGLGSPRRPSHRDPYGSEKAGSEQGRGQRGLFLRQTSTNQTKAGSEQARGVQRGARPPSIHDSGIDKKEVGLIFRDTPAWPAYGLEYHRGNGVKGPNGRRRSHQFGRAPRPGLNEEDGHLQGIPREISDLSIDASLNHVQGEFHRFVSAPAVSSTMVRQISLAARFREVSEWSIPPDASERTCEPRVAAVPQMLVARVDEHGSASERLIVPEAKHVEISSSTGDDEVHDAATDFIRMISPSCLSEMPYDSSVALQPFPTFFDPAKVVAANRKFRDFEGSWTYLPGGSGAFVDIGTIYPLGAFRELWDCFVVLCLLGDIWTTTFDLAYLEATRERCVLDIVHYVILGFYLVDIILNFNTGFVEKGTTIMARSAIVRRYLRGFFWIDLIALLPWEVIVAAWEGSGQELSWHSRATNLLRALRLLNYLGSAILAFFPWMRHQDSLLQQLLRIGAVHTVRTHMQFVGAVLFVAHLHSCIWGLLDDSHMKEPASKLGRAFETYSQDFHGAYEFFLGTDSAHSWDLAWGPESFSRAEPFWKWAFLFVVPTERLILFAFIAYRVSMAAIRATLSSDRESEEIVQYLRKHQVSLNTQVEVFFNIAQTAGARKLQQTFDQLMHKELPRHLHQAVCEELWEPRLQTLGLIRHMEVWHSDFVAGLCQVVYEEVHGTNALLFSEGEPSFNAYYIIQGEVTVLKKICPNDIPNFTEGMWVGESALISNLLRRSIRIGTVQMTSFMVVPSLAFHDTMSKLGLIGHFEKFCAEHLWRGLCGRCGRLGDHFTDRCPRASAPPIMDHVTAVRRFTRVVSLTLWSQSRRHQDDLAQQSRDVNSGRDLRWFLQDQKLARLTPVLAANDIYNLEDLERNNVAEIIRGRGVRLTSAEEAKLSKASIDDFRTKTAMEVRSKLSQHFSRLHHFVFLSHYKLEAGTEAALVRTELAQLFRGDLTHAASRLEVPVFLDSDNLSNLEDLMEKVRMSHNLVLLLTKNVLSRPWVLLELVTAYDAGINIHLVAVQKEDESRFQYPTDDFYTKLRQGNFLNQQGQQKLESYSVDLKKLEEVLRQIFQKIAVPYSPHAAETVRQAQLQHIVKDLSFKQEDPFTPQGSLDMVVGHRTESPRRLEPRILSPERH